MSTPSPRPAVFLDRDGVLIKAPIVKGAPAAIRSVADLELTRDAASFCATLRERGVPLFVFTNQPDVVRGLTSRYVVEQINTAVSSSLGITETAVCWTDDDDDPRRKPNPGMILELADAHGIDVAASVTIGDRWRDIVAGERAGSATVFIDRNYDERGPDAPELTVPELGKALDWVLERLGV